MVILKRFTNNRTLFLLLAILFSIISSRSLFHSGLPPTHDGEYHVIRFYEFDKTLRDGSLYPRWAPDLNNEFGIPLFNYVYPLPNYVASLFHFLGFSFIDSFKLNLLVASIFGAIFMFFWSKQFWGDLGGLISSVFYTFSPYHFLDIYIRGSVGEVWALAFFPAFLWSITRFIKDNNSKYFIFSSIFLSFIIFSHNILAFMFFFFAFAYSIFLFLSYKKSSIFVLLSIFVLAIGISSIFWVPAVLERGYVRGLEVYDYSKNFPEFYQLIFPSWGSGFNTSTLGNQLSFQIGITNLIAIVLGIVLFIKQRNKILLFSLVSFLAVFFLMLSISTPVWKTFPFMNYFQFPWRFLSLEILLASFMAGSLVNLFNPKIVTVLLVIFSILLGIGYTSVAYYLERPDSYYTTRSNFIDSTNSPGNAFNTIWFDSSKAKESKRTSLEDKEIKKKEIKSTNYFLETEVNSTKKIIINTAYFPGWSVYVDNHKIETYITKNGLFSFELEKGVHDVTIRFEETMIRKFAAAISIFSILLLLFARSFFATIKR